MRHVTHINGSCYTYDSVMSQMRLSHVTYEWVIAHIIESWHIWIIAYARGISRMNESCHVCMSHVTYKRVDESCHVWMSHITYERVMSHGWVMSRMIERRYVRWWSNPTLDCWVWMRHVTYEWDMSHMNESYHKCMSHVTYEWVMCVTYSSFRSLVQCIAGVPLRNGRAHARRMI